MIGLDTNVVVAWSMRGTQHHEATRAFFREQIEVHGEQFAVAKGVLLEFVHVVTDAKRFSKPMHMPNALRLARRIWTAPEITGVVPTTETMLHTLELMEKHKLGRQRILETSLAATYKGAHVTRLATFNEKDFRIFSFLETMVPGRIS